VVTSASPAYFRSQTAIFSGIAVRAGIWMRARQNGFGCSPSIHVAISLHLGSTIPKQIDCVS
jgi:hypothetical protein